MPTPTTTPDPGWPKLRELMGEQGHTASSLHRATGIGRAMISALMKGERDPSATTTRLLASALGVDQNEMGLPIPRPAVEG